MRGVARFVRVETYPSTGFPDAMMGWPESTAAIDALLRAARPVVELYSEALSHAGYEGPRSTLYVYPQPNSALPASIATVSIWAEKPTDFGGERGFIHVSPDLSPLTVETRAEFMLAGVDEIMRQLCRVRGWDPGPLDACLEHVQSREFEFTWNGPWKSSPDRRHEARAEFIRRPIDGWGRARLVVRDRKSHELLGSSEEAISSSTLDAFNSSAKTLRWTGSAHVSFAPYGAYGVKNWESQLVQARLDPQVTFTQPEPIELRQPRDDWAADNPAASSTHPRFEAAPDRPYLISAGPAPDLESRASIPASRDEEALARLEALLRRPGEIFTDEWEGYQLRYNGPGISTSWFFGAPDHRVNVHLEWEDNWSRAWDSMRDNREFSDWYLQHELALDEPWNEVIFEERAARHMRVSHKGDLVLRVPYTEVWEAIDEVAAFREIIWQVLSRRARAQGLPMPPQIS